MVLFPYSIGYSVTVERFEASEFPKWLGTGKSIERGEPFLGDRASFELRAGWITLSSRTPSTAPSGSTRYGTPVGHALGKVLKIGDELQITRDCNGGWTYLLMRAGELEMGVGQLKGKYGTQLEIGWRPEGEDTEWLEHPPGRSYEPRPRKASSHAMVCISSQRFELKEKEEIKAATFYLKCIDLGDDPQMFGGWPPRIAMVATEEPAVRDALAGFFAFEEELARFSIELNQKLFPRGPNAVQREWAPGEYMEDRAQKLKLRNDKINEMYREFGMPPPEYI
jgi:hypothetical protein